MTDKNLGRIKKMRTDGFSVAKIAKQLHISETTVRFHLMSPKNQKEVRAAKLRSYHRNH
jgi:predicted ArsR family transcriptional regulator